MIEEPDGQEESPDSESYLEHSVFPSTLPPFEVIARFWTELHKILPADELHVVDPYALDAGGVDPAEYAREFATLLKPALLIVRSVVVVHGKPREGIRGHLAQQLDLIGQGAEIQFHKGNKMHGRYLVADRSRVLRMDFSFNGIRRYFGTVSVVDDAQDLEGILDELERLHPFAVLRDSPRC